VNLFSNTPRTNTLKHIEHGPHLSHSWHRGGVLSDGHGLCAAGAAVATAATGRSAVRWSAAETAQRPAANARDGRGSADDSPRRWQDVSEGGRRATLYHTLPS